MLEHCHQPDRLIVNPASTGELRVSSDELHNADFRLPVLLNFEGKQLNRSTQQVCVESPSDAGMVAPDCVRLEVPRKLAR